MAVSTQRCFFACRRTEQDAMIRKETCTCTRASHASNQLARPARPLEDGERQCVVRRITWQGFAPALTTTILAEVSAIPTNPAETASEPQGRGLETTGLDWTVASRLWAIYELNSNKEPAIVLGEAILHPVIMAGVNCVQVHVVLISLPLSLLAQTIITAIGIKHENPEALACPTFAFEPSPTSLTVPTSLAGNSLPAH